MKKINELTYEDCKELLHNNFDLECELIDWFRESAGFWVEEYLTDISGCDYSIGCYGHNYFEIENWYNFSCWFESVQEKFEFVSAEKADTVRKYVEYAEIYEHVESLYWYDQCKEKDYRKVEELTEQYQEQAEKIILDRLQSEYNYDDCCLISEFESWIEGKIADPDNAYMTDDYKIFEHVPEYTVKAYEAQII